MTKKINFLTLDFWMLASMLISCIIFSALFEIIPLDFFLNERAFKNNSEYVYRKDLHRMMLCSSVFYSKSLDKYYADPKLLFENTVYLCTSKFKNKKTAIVNIDGVHFVAHKFSTQGFWGWISSFVFKTSQAYRAWHYGHILEKAGINCAKPLLIIEKRFGPHCTSSYLITNYISGLDGAQFFQNKSPYKEQWEEAVDNLQNMFLKLENEKIIHSNFGLNNFIIKNGMPYLIDLDKLQKLHFRHYAFKKSISKKYVSILNDELKASEKEAFSALHSKLLLMSS